jgi:hypothetical protein
MTYIPQDLWKQIKSYIFLPCFTYLKFFRMFVLPFIPKHIPFHEQFNIKNIKSKYKINYYFLSFKPFIYYNNKTIGPYLYRNMSIKFSNYIIVSYSNYT